MESKDFIVAIYTEEYGKDIEFVKIKAIDEIECSTKLRKYLRENYNHWYLSEKALISEIKTIY
jgi:hypothetical protein